MLKAAFEKLETKHPSRDAEDRAIAAGLRAFRDSRQKNRARPRLMIDTINTTWEWIMGHRLAFGTVAAAVLVFPISAAIMTTTGIGPFRLPVEEQVTGRLVPDGEAVRHDEAPPAGAGGVTVIAPPSTMTHRAQKDGTGRDMAASETVAAPPVIAQRPVAEAKARPDMRTYQNQVAAPARTRSMPQDMLGTIASPAPEPAPVWEPEPRLAPADGNEVTLVSEAPVSTFSIDVDTASYARLRRSLVQGTLPAPADVRVEEMINYFSYDYPAPQAGEAPFRTSVALYPSPWNANTKLLHIGIKGHEIAAAERPRANLVFLIDTSGSMSGPDRLPLLRTALRLLAERLRPDDTVSIVTYSGAAGTVLEPTKGADRSKIINAIMRLQSGGSTAGAAGIREAYALAARAFDKGGINRVILATDGDFNVGMRDTEQLKAYIAEKRKTGVFLSVLGVGEGNYRDELMQALAQNGNGNAAYIDTLKEAEKVLVTEATSTLFPIAKDVKIQIEFNPAKVAAYRLIGYETRMLRRQDFNNDRIDAGEIGSGHTVTAIYEITPAGSGNTLVDDLRYQAAEKPAGDGGGDEYAFLKLRYKQPDGNESTKIEIPVTSAAERPSVDVVGTDMRFAAAVAAFGQKLRGQGELEAFSYAEIGALAASAKGADAYGLRAEFIDLVRLAGLLAPAQEHKTGGTAD